MHYQSMRRIFAALLVFAACEESEMMEPPTTCQEAVERIFEGCDEVYAEVVESCNQPPGLPSCLDEWRACMDAAASGAPHAVYVDALTTAGTCIPSSGGRDGGCPEGDINCQVCADAMAACEG